MNIIETQHQNLHLQGFARGGSYLYWSFTDSLVKTTLMGTVKCQVEIRTGHLGDCDWYDGKIYATLLGKPLPGHRWDDWTAFDVYVFNDDDLTLEKVLPLTVCYDYWAVSGSSADTRGFSGVDGITVAPDPESGEPKLFIACALRDDDRFSDQIILQYTLNGVYETEYRIPTGNTVFGIQNLDYDCENGVFWFTTYEPKRNSQPPERLFCVSGDLKRILRKYPFSSPYGIECMGSEGFLCSVQFGVNGNRGGIAYPCTEEFFKNAYKEHDLTENYVNLLNP